MGWSVSGIRSRVAEKTEEIPNTSRHSSAMTVATGRFSTNFVIPICQSPLPRLGALAARASCTLAARAALTLAACASCRPRFRSGCLACGLTGRIACAACPLQLHLRPLIQIGTPGADRST